MEKSIGSSLFIRQKRGVMLTPAGKQFLIHSKQLMQQWDVVKSNVYAAHHDVQGSVTLGCHTSVALHCLHNFIPALLKKYPKLEIFIKHDHSRKITEQVINLNIDIGIVVNPIKEPNLILRKLYEDEFTFWYSSKHKKINMQSDDFTLLCDPDCTQTQNLLNQCKKYNINYSRMITSNNFEVLSKLTAEGCGIGVLPARVVLATYPTKLKRIAHAPIRYDEIHLAYRHENRDIKNIQAVTEAIKEFFKSTRK